MNERSAERSFRRMVIGMCAGAGSDEALRQAAQLASQLGIEVEGLFIEDETLFGLAAMPFLREIQAGTAMLRPFDLSRLERELRSAAELQRRALEAAAQGARASWRFACKRGEIETVLAGNVAASDIVAILEGGAIADRSSHAAQAMRRAAIRSAASVLYIASRSRRRAGEAVVAVLQKDDDNVAVLHNAARIAGQSGKTLVVLAVARETVEADRIAAIAREFGVADERIQFRRLEDENVEALSHALDAIDQGMIVMPRGALGLADEEALMQLAARYRVPVLVVEPHAANPES